MVATPVTLEVAIKAKPSADWQVVLDCIDMLGVLVPDDHQWTATERRTYERAVRVVKRLMSVEVQGGNAGRVDHGDG